MFEEIRMSQPNPNMTYEELHDSLIPTLMVFGSNFDPIERPNEANSVTDKAVDELIQLFATLCAEVIGKIPPESEHWRYSGELLGRIQQQIQSTNRLAQLTTKNTEEENV